jgi:flagellar basal-body rod modification protein FlgD
VPIASTPSVTATSASQTPVVGAAAADPAAASAETAASKLDQDTFLKLMVAQLRNQDPLNPTDSAEFLAQTAQFTSLERLNQVADASAQALSAQMAFGASGLIGRSVTYADADGNELSGTVSSVRFETTGPVLSIDGEDVTLSQVITVGTGAASGSATGGASDESADAGNDDTGAVST